MMMVIRASTDARTPKMMVPVESVFVSVLAGSAAGFVNGYDLRVVLESSAGIVAMRVLDESLLWSWMRRQLSTCSQIEEASS